MASHDLNGSAVNLAKALRALTCLSPVTRSTYQCERTQVEAARSPAPSRPSGSREGRVTHHTTLTLLLWMAVLSVSPAWAQMGTIQGTVTDSESSSPLPNTNLILVGTARGTITGLDGTFEMRMAPGAYTLQASFIGYQSAKQSVVVTTGDTVTVEFEMTESAVPGDEFVVVGSRTVRTALETPAPVDIISEREIHGSGETEINQTLRHLVPSFNVSHQTISDGTDHINPASLRGLGPDQVLVLINGKRRHASALVHVNGTFGRGTVGVDLNAIPKAAIARVEILRDGAASQYGSDAIAGVVNIVLKSSAEGIRVNSLLGTTGEGDGDQVKVDVNTGFSFGEGGYVNVTSEFLDRGRTTRGGLYTGKIYADGIEDETMLNARGQTREDFSMKIGQSKATVGAAFYNAVYPLTDGAQFYSFGGLSHRRGKAAGFYRLPRQEERVVFALYPDGFLPEINPEIEDRSFSAGLRGPKGAWDIDFSMTRGGNSFQFNIENTNNASMGTASPISFDAGRLSFDQISGNLDLVRPLETGAVERATLVLGSEFRVENYRIEAGQFESYSLGNGDPGDIAKLTAGVDYDTTASGSLKAAGSQVFGGFRPASEVDRFRHSISAYAGLENQVSKRLTVDLGGRFEQYSDFGNTATGKAALRYEVSDEVALRGTVSNGFRAPSLHQVWFNNVSTQFLVDEETGELVPQEVLTAHNKSAVTKAFGIPALTAETSVNLSGGITARPGDSFSITADYYQIAINDRIVLTSRFSASNAMYGAILEPFRGAGVTQAQFFANAVNTSTRGVDLVASYATGLNAGMLELSGAANFTRTTVDGINISEVFIAAFREANGRDPDADEHDVIKNTLFNREEKNRFEDALPKAKLSLSARYTQGRLSVLGRATRYGPVAYKPINADNDEIFSAKTLVDMDLSCDLLPGVRLSVGANNLLNTFPDPHRKSANIGSRGFVYSRRVTQFGVNGGFYYVRLRFGL